MNGHLKILAKLVMEKEFRDEMDKNVNDALKKAKIKVDQEFIEKLKDYSKKTGFKKLGKATVNDINKTIGSDFGLESRW